MSEKNPTRNLAYIYIYIFTTHSVFSCPHSCSVIERCSSVTNFSLVVVLAIMARRGGGGRPAPRAAPRAPVRSPPQPVAHAPPPAPVQPSGGGSMLSGIGSTIAQGVAFGTGSAIAHRAVDAVVGPRTVQHEYAPAETPAAQNGSLSVANMGGMDTCANQAKAFQDCISNYGSDISKCQFYVDMLNECRRGPAPGNF